MTLQLVLIIAFGGAAATYGLGKVSAWLRDCCAVIVSALLVVIIGALYGKFLTGALFPSFIDVPLSLRLDALSWFFAIAISLVGFLSVVFSLSYIKGRERTDFYYLAMLLINASMIGIVLSADLLSFFIFWETMSWSTFLLISYNRGNALPAGMKYMAMSIVGSVAYLIAMFSIYHTSGTLVISALGDKLADASQGYTLFLLLLFFVAFGIKNAVLPFHTWLPDAHSEAPSPFSAVLSGILVRMGMYGFVLAFFVIITLKQFLGLRWQSVHVHHVIAWIGALNIVIPTFIAMLQNDSKRLLAWHGVGQGGYMVVGVALGTSLGVSGGIFHIVNHTSYIALLFLVVGAIEHRTGGVRDLNSLGGLINKMPITFVGALVGACGLIGAPLTNGFVSKWLIYKTLILEHYPFLAFAALVGTWGTILSLYKFLHNIFLGQLPEQYKNIKKAPISMQIPIMAYSAIILIFGIFPGIPLSVTNRIIASFGLQPLKLTLSGVVSENGAVNTLNILFALTLACVVVWLILRAGRKSRVVPQEDSYAAGSAIPVGRYNYTVKFYDPLDRMIRPFLRDVIDEFYYWIAAQVRTLSEGLRRIYTGDVGNYVVYILLFAALLVISRAWWKLW
jgi:formate hydrogenlyase subunit 3/multisubunit Na+/H+ antiporter MnhD subunit